MFQARNGVWLESRQGLQWGMEVKQKSKMSNKKLHSGVQSRQVPDFKDLEGQAMEFGFYLIVHRESLKTFLFYFSKIMA